MVADAGDGEPAVSIGSLRFEADEEEKRRDREETKRLLYVALTRARERLYLATALGPEGRWAPGVGSLAEVLPRGFADVIAASADGGEVVARWEAGARVHQFRACRPVARLDGFATAGLTGPLVDLLAPVPSGERLQTTTVRSRVQPEPTPSRLRWDAADVGSALAGRLVHRLFQALDPGMRGAPVLEDDTALMDAARRHVTDEERAVVPDLDATVSAACETWRALRGRQDVHALFEGAEASYEVPFSLRLAHGDSTVIVRGAIDCLIVRADGEIVVVEIKTGSPAAWHHAQLDLYVQAAQGLVPGAAVRGVLLGPWAD